MRPRIAARLVLMSLWVFAAGAFAQEQPPPVVPREAPERTPPLPDTMPMAPDHASAHQRASSDQMHMDAEQNAPAGAPELPDRDRPPNDHVPPAPPARAVTAMATMSMMQMHDDAARATLLVQRLEYRQATRGGDGAAWQAEAWWGRDLDRAWFKSEGERGADGLREARSELAWSHAVAAFWDTQLGLRVDHGAGPSRRWVALGIEGLAPYWFELAATLYAGTQERTAARLEAAYELNLTQRWILRPQLELDAYGKRDPARGVRAGLSDAEAGLRLRYEFSRRLAPYLGIDWRRRLGRFDVPWRREPAREFAWVAGLRFWF